MRIVTSPKGALSACCDLATASKPSRGGRTGCEILRHLTGGNTTEGERYGRTSQQLSSNHTCRWLHTELLSSRLTSFSPIDLTKYGSHVYVLVRRDELRAPKNHGQASHEQPQDRESVHPHLASNPFALHLVPSTKFTHMILFSLRRSSGTPSRSNVKVMVTFWTTSASRTY